jgi:hypothetical protein
MATSEIEIFWDKREADGRTVRFVPYWYPKDSCYKLLRRSGDGSNLDVNAIRVGTLEEVVQWIKKGYALRMAPVGGGSASRVVPEKITIHMRGSTPPKPVPQPTPPPPQPPAAQNQPPYQPKDEDRRETSLQEVKRRQGQPEFRRRLLDRYGKQCMISGCDVITVLEAAHIQPYRGEEDNHVENGLILRSDLHTLFDAGLLGICPETRSVILDETLLKSDYWQWHEKPLKCEKLVPSKAALLIRWKAFNGK